MKHKCCEKKHYFSSLVESHVYKQMKIFFFSIDWRNKKIIFPMNHKCCEKKSSDTWYCEKKSLLFKSRRESCIVIMSEHKQMKNIFFSID